MVNIQINNSKKWYQSKTLWVNILAGIAALATGLSQIVSTGEAISFMAIVNIILRFISSSKLE